METCKYNEIAQEELVQMFKDALQSDSVQLCFLLGAGASRSSGIPTGRELSKLWYEEIKKNLGVNEAWMQKITDKNIGEYYTII
jgi:NAD-dependent SIR2 family protein deacetylase